MSFLSVSLVLVSLALTSIASFWVEFFPNLGQQENTHIKGKNRYTRIYLCLKLSDQLNRKKTRRKRSIFKLLNNEPNVVNQ